LSEARRFQQLIGTELAAEFAGDFRFYRSRLELRRTGDDGADVIILAGSAKWSPLISLSFYFGRSFDLVRQIEKQLGWSGLPYHIQQYSLNLRHMSGIGYAGRHTWDIDLRQPPSDLAREIKAAIQGMAFPFFERFRELSAARDAIATDDPWCFGGRGPFWRSLFLMDAALDDLAHFRKWSERLEPFYAAQAAEALARLDGRSSGGQARVSNREDPLQVSGDIVDTHPSGTKPRR
jgi:hypothetical protein